MTDDRRRGARGGDSEDPPAIDVRDVSVAYGDEQVLEGVSTSVDRGELVGLVGPNGAGKTTLLHTVTAALDPDDGTVLVDGDDVRTLSSAAASRRIAVVPQETVPSFGFTVRQIVEMGRHPHRSRFDRRTLRDSAHVERAMEQTGTARFAERSVDEVSGGERQRALLARALAQDAPVLVLDEPTANLDLNHAAETMSIVRDLVRDGRTAVAAIHDLELAARFCDRLLLLADGSVVAAGRPADVLQSDRLEAAFDTPAAVEPEPIGGVAVQPLVGDGIDAGVHVVGGGQLAARALGSLGDAGVAGVDLSLGPVATGDRAAATADALGATVVDVPPFQPVPDERLGDARSLAAAADAVVLAAGGADDCPLAWQAVCEAATPVVGLEHAGDSADSESAEDTGSDATASSSNVVATATASELPAVVAGLGDGGAHGGSDPAADAAAHRTGDRTTDQSSAPESSSTEDAADTDSPLADGGRDDRTE